MTPNALEEHLIAWNEGIRQGLQKTRFRSVADDVAQTISLEMLVDMKKGRPVPIWPGSLPAEMLRLAIRKASKESRVAFESFRDQVPQPRERYEGTRKRMATAKKLKKIEREFTKPVFDQMVEFSKTNHDVNQRSLSVETAIPYRTFKYKVRKARFSARYSIESTYPQ